MPRTGRPFWLKEENCGHQLFLCPVPPEPRLIGFDAGLPILVMRKHKHSSRHGPYPILTRGESAASVPAAPKAPSFSKRLLDVIPAGDIDLPRQHGFQDDFDLKGLTSAELQAVAPDIRKEVAETCIRIASLHKGPVASAASASPPEPVSLATGPSLILWKARPRP